MIVMLEHDPVDDPATSQFTVSIEDIRIRILTSMRRIIRAVDVSSRRLEEEMGVTTPQLVALRAVVEAGSITPSGLAEKVHLSPSTMIGIIDRLEEKEFVERCRDREDRRRMNVTPTEAGRRLVQAAPMPLQHTLAERLLELSDLERLAIATALERVVDLMEVRSMAASPMLERGPLLRPPSAGPTGA